MIADQTPNSEDASDDSPTDSSGPQSQQVQHSQVSALVPEKVACGVFSTGAVILNGPHEFVVDFLLRMTKPHQVAARVVLPPAVIPRLIGALRENVENYKKRFGEPVIPHDLARSPQPSQQVQSSAQELYEQLKFSDENMSGVYANAVMIGHTATEFSFDFITTFFPRSTVSSRVYLSAPNVPRFLDSLVHSFEQYQRKSSENPTPPTTPPSQPIDPYQS